MPAYFAPLYFTGFGVVFVVVAWRSKDGDFRWGRTGKGPVMSTRLGKAIFFTLGLVFGFLGLIWGIVLLVSHSG
jgi:hypothetical protein